MDNRAVSPVVEKTLAAGIVVLYVGAMTTLFVGGVVPDYRAATGQEVAERTHAAVLAEIDSSIPETGASAAVRTRVEVPATIRASGYDIVLESGDLVLDHPDDSIGVRTSVWTPAGTTIADGRVDSGATLVIVVEGDHGNRTVSIGEVS